MFISYICTICEKSSNPECNVASKGLWICPECAERIKKLIYPKEAKKQDCRTCKHGAYNDHFGFETCNDPSRNCIDWSHWTPKEKE